MKWLEVVISVMMVILGGMLGYLLTQVSAVNNTLTEVRLAAERQQGALSMLIDMRPAVLNLQTSVSDLDKRLAVIERSRSTNIGSR